MGAFQISFILERLSLARQLLLQLITAWQGIAVQESIKFNLSLEKP